MDMIIKIKQYRKTLLFIAAAIFIFAFKSFVMNRVIINGNSMESKNANSLKNGDVVFTEKITKYCRIDRFDVVVIKIKGRVIVKRVIGLPNEAILIADGKTYIDGEELIEENKNYIEDSGIAAEYLYLSDDQYFVLGDNRNDSYDSREIGAVYRRQIIGKPTFRFFPFDRIGRVE